MRRNSTSIGDTTHYQCCEKLKRVKNLLNRLAIRYNTLGHSMEIYYKPKDPTTTYSLETKVPHTIYLPLSGILISNSFPNQ
jgi:hypothetical protein